MKLMYLTADPEYAIEAQEAGIDRVFCDLEYINKVERQMGRNTLISHNDIEDVAKLRKVLDKSELLVRVNSLYQNSKYEIDKVISDGAEVIMLPMVYDAEDVKEFVELVGGRAKTCPMIETAQAMARLDSIMDVGGVDELFIGLNDLHISMDLTFMFELLSGGLVEYMANKISARNIPFGFGGMAKIGEGILPAESILAEHFRLNSSSVILSRTFRNEVGDNTSDRVNLKEEIAKIRKKEEEIKNWTSENFERNRLFSCEKVKEIVEIIQKK